MLGVRNRESSGIVEVRELDDGRGQRLIAAEGIAAGGTVLVEYPLVAVQCYPNQAEVQLCHHCLRYTGTMASQICHLVKTAFEGLPTAAELGLKLGWDEQPSVCCEQCSRQYCSETCMAADHDTGHWGWLCAANDRWQSFITAAQDTGSEHFEIAALLVCSALHRAATDEAYSLDDAQSMVLGFATVDYVHHQPQC